VSIVFKPSQHYFLNGNLIHEPGCFSAALYNALTNFRDNSEKSKKHSYQNNTSVYQNETFKY